MNERTYAFVGGYTEAWRVLSIWAQMGETLTPVERVDIRPGRSEGLPPTARWLLRGVVSHERYVTLRERQQLVARQPALGRPGAVCAALIRIRKSSEWWALAQDERRALLEERSHHIEIGIDYLPAVARRLHHGRDHGEPFDFLTWFEFAPEHVGAFDRLLTRLRATEEWKYVEREVELRLVRAPTPSR